MQNRPSIFCLLIGLALGFTSTGAAQLGGVMVGLGTNRYGNFNTPIATIQKSPIKLADNITRVFTTPNQSFLLKPDGRLLASGYNRSGSLGNDQGNLYAFAEVANGIVDFSAADHHLLTVDAQHVLRGRGSNTYNQLGFDAPDSVFDPLVIAENVTQVSGTSRNLILWLTEDGKLWGMGANAGNLLGVSFEGAVESPVVVATQVNQILSVSDTTVLFRSAEGALWGIGLNSQGQLGLGHQNSQLTPVKLADDVVDAQTRNRRTVYVKTDGSLWGMGLCEYSEFGSDVDYPRITPVQIATDVAQVALGQNHLLWVDTSGTLRGVGKNHYGQLGLGDLVPRTTATVISSGVTAVSAGYRHSLFLRTDGSAWGTGSAEYGELGTYVTHFQSTTHRSDSRVLSTAAHHNYTYFLREDRTLWSVGQNDQGVRGLDPGIPFSDTSNHIDSGVEDMAVSFDHALYRKSDGTVWFLGNSRSGRAGILPEPTGIEPVMVATGATSIAISNATSYYVDNAGVLWGSGDNHNYKLGANASYPTQSEFFAIDSNVVSVYGKYEHTLYLKADGTLWGLGSNQRSQLGDSPPLLAVHPVLIASNVASAACGSNNSYFITEDGDLMGLGESTYGQLGNADEPFENPTPQFLARDVVVCAAGGAFVVWINHAGELWGLGRSSNGELGEPWGTDEFTPRFIAPQVTSVSATGSNTVFTQIPDAHLTNLSTRVNLSDTGGGLLTVGFVVAGIEPLEVLIRAVGPGLSDFDIEGAMPNPSLKIFTAADELVAENDDWSTENQHELSTIFTELGAFSLDDGSRDAALVVTLPPGPYTARVRRGENPGGVVLLEVYNRTPHSWYSRLVNLSVRTDAGSDENTLTAGFVIEGQQNASLLVRAVGPTLGDFGVPEFLADPQLAINRGPELIASNDNWSDDTSVVAEAADVGAFPLRSGSADAAMVIGLGPGAYTAQAQTKDSATGSALIEIYQIDN